MATSAKKRPPQKQQLRDSEYTLTPRQHIRRFGQYVLDTEDKPEPLQPKPVPLTTVPKRK